MIEFKQILCPIDFSDTSARALVHATSIARWYEARLTVLHVVPGLDSGLPPDAQRGDSRDSGDTPDVPLRERVMRDMRAAAAEAGAEALRPVLAVEDGRAHEAIVNRAMSLPADLIVIGTHGRGGFNRLLIGSVAEKVLRTASCAVLAVPPSAPPASDARSAFERILCPIDFSPSSLKALRLALDLARQANGRVTALHAVEYLDESEPCEHVDPDTRKYRARIVERGRERLRALVADESRTWCEIDEVVVVGRAYREILRRATESNADLIVMGAQGHGGIELMLYGSNTQHVVRRATCPVLTVRA